MVKQNAPAREGKGVVCLLGSADYGVPTIAAARAQFLTRYGIPSHRCGLIGSLYFGEGRHDV